MSYTYIATVNAILYLVGGKSSDLILEWDPVEEEWLEAGHLSTSGDMLAVGVSGSNLDLQC